MIETTLTPQETERLATLKKEHLLAQQRTAEALSSYEKGLKGILLERLIEAERAEGAIMRQIKEILSDGT
jgi:hypothetical protein